MAEFYIEFVFFFEICFKLFVRIVEKYENFVLVTVSIDTHVAKKF